MKRVVIFVLVAALALGGICLAHGVIWAQQDDVRIYPNFQWGDASVLRDRMAHMSYDLGQHLRWDCTYDFDGDTTQTVFSYSHEGNLERVVNPVEFRVDMTLNFGASISQWTGYLSQTAYGDMVREVAKETPDGESRSMELNMSEYAEYYLYELWIDYSDSERCCWISDGSHEWLSGPAEKNRDPFALAFNELFRFPVQEDEVVLVTAGREPNGQITSYGFSSQSGTKLYFDGTVTAEGLYFIPIFRDAEQSPLEYESPMGHGLYFAPWKHREGEYRQWDGGKTIPMVEPDLSKLELRRALPLETIHHVSVDEELGRLWLLTENDGTLHMTILELQTGQVVAAVEVLPASQNQRYVYFVKEEDKLLVASAEQLALLDAANGEVLLTAPVETPGEPYYQPSAFDADYGCLRYDGETLTILSRGQGRDTAFWVQVYEQGKLLYHGEFDSTLSRGGASVDNWNDMTLQ